MDAKELYALSIKNKRTKGLSARVRNTALRAGLGVNGVVDYNKVYSAIFSGDVWGMRGMGAATIKKLCEWVTDSGAGDEQGQHEA